MISGMVLVVFVSAHIARAARTYEYVEEVGEGKEHDKIYKAIEAMNEKEPPLDYDRLGCIEVYPGTYEEQLNDYYAPNGYNLPAHCDLIGMGSSRDDVVIEHLGESDGCIGRAGVTCNGDNIIEDLKINNTYIKDGNWVQDSVLFKGEGELNNCKVVCGHRAVWGWTDLVVTGCDIYSYFLFCIRVHQTFLISDCRLYPRGYAPELEWPTGIRTGGSGTVKDVSIYAKCTYEGTEYGGTGVYGIRLWSGSGEYVEISDTYIELELTSAGDEPGIEPEVRGIWVDGADVLIRDCTIDVTGIKATGGADVTVDGVFVEGGGTVEVHGVSKIRTRRDPADSDQEKLLRVESGSLSANLYTVDFNPNGDVAPDCYDEDYVVGTINEIGGNFCVKDSSGMAVACFDILGNLLLKGSKLSWVSPGAGDEFIIENASGPVAYISESGNLYTQGSVSQYSWHSASGSADEFRVQEPSGGDVAIIDGTNGNVYLRGKLEQGWGFCQ